MEKVNLNPIEATSYYWTNRIKGKMKELTSKSGIITLNERNFCRVFNEYTAEDYRHLYLELIKLIEQDVKYFKNRQAYFYQDTALGRHNRLNEELSFINRKPVSDIRLSSYDSKDIVIYTNNSNALRWYKSGGIRYLSTTYEPDYILTGDEKLLDIYNLLLAVIVLLDNNYPQFEDINGIKDAFGKIYLKHNPSENEASIQNLFDNVFNALANQEMVVGYTYQKTYFSSYQHNDLNGLEYYYPLAKEIVEEIKPEKIVYQLKK